MNNSLENGQEALRLAEQLRRAVRNEPAPPFLEARIRNTIRSSRRGRSWMRALIPALAAVVICLAAGIAYQLGHLRLTASSQESYIASVSSRVATLMRVGLGDHIHCSVFRKFPKNPPGIEDLGQKLAPEYRELIPIVRKQITEQYRLVIAHQCRYHGRRFVHLALKSDSKLLSLVIARKNEGESLASADLGQALTQSGISLYRAGVQRFEIASFESRDHLVYFVSDLTQPKNMEMMLALAPQVKALLRKLES